MSERPNRRDFAARPAKPEQWIKAADTAPRDARDAGFSARLTIDVTPDQRARIKIAAFKRGVTVTEALRELLAREFPTTGGDPS